MFFIDDRPRKKIRLNLDAEVGDSESVPKNIKTNENPKSSVLGKRQMPKINLKNRLLRLGFVEGPNRKNRRLNDYDNTPKEKHAYELLNDLVFLSDESDIKKVLNAWLHLRSIKDSLLLSTKEAITPLVLLCVASVKLEVNLLEGYSIEEIVKMPWHVSSKVKGIEVHPFNILIMATALYPQLSFSNVIKAVIDQYKNNDYSEYLNLIKNAVNPEFEQMSSADMLDYDKIVKAHFIDEIRLIEEVNALTFSFDRMSLVDKNITSKNSSVMEEESTHPAAMELMTPPSSNMSG